MVDEAPNEASLQVNPDVVGLAGLEPAASSLSGIDSRAPCYPAFSQVVRDRKCYRDGVNGRPLTMHNLSPITSGRA
jgi:hypothetical protein